MFFLTQPAIPPGTAPLQGRRLKADKGQRNIQQIRRYLQRHASACSSVSLEGKCTQLRTKCLKSAKFVYKVQSGLKNVAEFRAVFQACCSFNFVVFLLNPWLGRVLVLVLCHFELCRSPIPCGYLLRAWSFCSDGPGMCGEKLAICGYKVRRPTNCWISQGDSQGDGTAIGGRLQ